MLVGPGINIEGYRRADSKPDASVSVLDMVVRPLETVHHVSVTKQYRHRNWKSASNFLSRNLSARPQDRERFLEAAAMLRVQNSDTAEDFSVLVLEEEREAVGAALQQAIREAVGSGTQVRKVLLTPGDPIPKEVAGAVVLVTDCHSKQTARVLAHLRGTASVSRPMALRCGVRAGLDGFVQLVTNMTADGSLSLLIEVMACSRLRVPVVAVSFASDTVHQCVLVGEQARDMPEEATMVVHVRAEDPVPADLEVPAGGNVILVWQGLPREGILGAIASARGKPYGARARYSRPGVAPKQPEERWRTSRSTNGQRFPSFQICRHHGQRRSRILPGQGHF